jgi:hypothetical protein
MAMVVMLEATPSSVSQVSTAAPEGTPGGICTLDLVESHKAGAEVLFAGANVDRIGTGGIDGDGADGEWWLIVGERGPVGAAVEALPEAALRRSEVDHVVIARIDGQCRHASCDRPQTNCGSIGGARSDRRPVFFRGGDGVGAGGIRAGSVLGLAENCFAVRSAPDICSIRSSACARAPLGT